MKATRKILERIVKIEEETKIKIAEELVLMAKNKNKIKADDVIKDHYHSIRVTKCTFSYSIVDRLVNLIYSGIELKVNGEPAKRQNNAIMHEGNIKLLNNAHYEKL